MSQPNTMLATLLQRGDQLSLDHGKLIIKPKSGGQVPSSWLSKYSDHLIREVITTIGQPAYWYTSFDTGKYKADGVCLQFVNIATGTSAFCCFNANLKRQRNSKHGKAGSYLPNRQFTVGKHSAFCQFWLRAALPLPNRLGKLYERMGNLKNIVFTANLIANEKLDKNTIAPLTITYEQLISTDNLRTSHGQLTDKPRTRSTDKETATDQQPHDLQPFSTTGVNYYGNKVIRGHGYKGSNVIPISTGNDQTIDEWLADYNSSE